MIRPVRIQLSRRRGFDLQALSRSINGLSAAVVSRPSVFGNPFRMSEFVTLEGDPLERKDQREDAVAFFAIWSGVVPRGDNVVDLSDVYLAELSRLKAALPRLRGHNLACWCPLQYPDGEPCPCHADVLLGGTAQGVSTGEAA